MNPADRAAALTKTWNLRRDWKRLKDDLDEKTSYDSFHGKQWTEVVVEVSSLIERVRPFDWLQMEFLVHSQRSVLDGVHTLRAIEVTRIALLNPEPDL